jgi:uncharacterized membrane protein SpoIIM required for sporulation
MNLPAFVREKRPRWQRLEQLLGYLEHRELKKLDRMTLHELSHLYRAAASDLAYAQTYFSGTTVLHFLHQLVGRAHHQIYRTEGYSWSGIRQFFRSRVPEAARACVGYITLAAIILASAFALGLVAAEVDPRVATLVVPHTILEDITAGRMWTRHIFAAVPPSVSTAFVFTNNLTVAFLCFVGGMTFGVYTVLLLVGNGFMLGVVFKLCAQNGLHFGLFEFVASHGFIELSAITLAGASGLVLAGALLAPGNYSRKDALSLRSRDAAALALGCAPALLAAGLVEAFISPAPTIPVWFKIILGLILFAAFWAYLFIGGRQTGDGIPLVARWSSRYGKVD